MTTGNISLIRVGIHSVALSVSIGTPAHADLLIPVLFATPLMLLGALIPAILIEGFVILARLDLGLMLAFAVSAANNIVSALIGVPLAFFLAGFLVDKAEASIRRKPSKLMRAFIAPILLGSGIWYDGIQPVQNKWVGWGAQVLLVVFFVPFFFVSWWLETFVASLILTDLAVDPISRTLMVANLITYFLLGALVLSSGFDEYKESRKELAESQKLEEKESDPH